MRIVTYDRVRDLEQPSEYPIWDKDFEKQADAAMGAVSRISGDILTWARGG